MSEVTEAIPHLDQALKLLEELKTIPVVGERIKTEWIDTIQTVKRKILAKK
jgi:hypothetical protein